MHFTDNGLKLNMNKSEIMLVSTQGSLKNFVRIDRNWSKLRSLSIWKLRQDTLVQ